jgi:hypothetical protein
MLRLVLAALVCLAVQANAQEIDDHAQTASQLDTIFINEVQNLVEPDKVLHAEPLYIDLIRDLGARAGEAEWNAAFDLTDRLLYDRYRLLVEYEWAPVDRLGLEIELPVTLYTGQPNGYEKARPSNRVESIKTAIQWTYHVDQTAALSLAVGYINELEFADLDRISSAPLLSGNLFNPFAVIAKRWGNNVHTMLYTGIRTHWNFDSTSASTMFEANFSMHHMISGTRNFVGIETNGLVQDGRWNAVVRPQMRLGLSEHLLVGLGVSIPVERDSERLGMFIRMILEP